MTPLPKKKHSKGRSNKRIRSQALKLPNLTRCLSCKKLKSSHQACPHCGIYKS